LGSTKVPERQFESEIETKLYVVVDTGATTTETGVKLVLVNAVVVVPSE
jgi:hypothetical protein